MPLEPGSKVQVYNPGPGLTGVIVEGGRPEGYGGHTYVRVCWDEDQRITFARADLLREVMTHAA